MIKTEKSKIKQELLDKQKLLSLRINSIEKQEGSLTGQLEKIRDKILRKDKKE